jgi:hypothetical protein
MTDPEAFVRDELGSRLELVDPNRYRVARIAITDACPGDVIAVSSRSGVPLVWRPAVHSVDCGSRYVRVTLVSGEFLSYPADAHVKIRIARPA